MSTRFELKVNSEALRNYLAHSITFSEEKLATFHKIQKDFIALVGDPAIEMESTGIDRGIDLIAGNCILQCKSYTKRSWLDNYIEVHLHEERLCRDHEQAERQMTGFQEYLDRRRQLHRYDNTDKEQKFINKVRISIELYREHACDNFYRQFRIALACYFNWLNRKICKQKRYVIYLYRLYCGAGIALDMRGLFRSIMRFRFRALDDEDGLSIKKINNFFYQLKSLYYEYRIYKTSI